MREKINFFPENIFSIRKCKQFSQFSKYDQQFLSRWSLIDPSRYLWLNSNIGPKTAIYLEGPFRQSIPERVKCLILQLTIGYSRQHSYFCSWPNIQKCKKILDSGIFKKLALLSKILLLLLKNKLFAKSFLLYIFLWILKHKLSVTINLILSWKTHFLQIWTFKQ